MSSVSAHFSVPEGYPRSVVSVFQHGLQLVAQFQRTFVAVCRDRVLHGGFKHFLFGAGDLERAILLTRVISTINRFSLCHTN